jgi:hypothetical protein
MLAEDHSDLLSDFKEYITTMDAERNTDFRTIFPELAHLVD